jgi:hypothetical protein
MVSHLQLRSRSQIQHSASQQPRIEHQVSKRTLTILPHSKDRNIRNHIYQLLYKFVVLYYCILHNTLDGALLEFVDVCITRYSLRVGPRAHYWTVGTYRYM